MKKFLSLLVAATFAISAPAATVKKSTNPAVTKQATTFKKKPPVSNVRPEVRTPKNVERKAILTKKKIKR